MAYKHHHERCLRRIVVTRAHGVIQSAVHYYERMAGQLKAVGGERPDLGH